MGRRNSGTIPYGVAWSQQFGAECPACGYFTKKSYKHDNWSGGRKVRWHRCQNPACPRPNFQSVAEDSPRLDPDPEKLRYLRDYSGKRGGIRITGWFG